MLTRIILGIFPGHDSRRFGPSYLIRPLKQRGRRLPGKGRSCGTMFGRLFVMFMADVNQQPLTIGSKLAYLSLIDDACTK